MANPYSDIYAQLRTVVATWPGVLALVRVGNLVPKNRPAQTAMIPADALRRNSQLQGGELRIEPATGGAFDPRATSSSAVGVQNFAVGISTADVDPDTMFEIKWQVELAINDAGEDLELPDLVRSVRFVDLAVSNQDQTLNRGRENAWAAVTTVSVTFWKSRASITTPE